MIENKEILVIGGGVAGISSALDLADQGHIVYLVEKNPSIGGKMSQLDKTFPTLDCSICILAPKMVECARHPRINLFTYSEVKKVEPIRDGTAFRVKILLKPRYIDSEKCTSCGTCAAKCPYKRYPNEFDAGLKKRGAAYIPFLQAVPATYLIDEENCHFIKTGKCKVCEKFCPTGAINFEQKPKEIEIEVASIVVATGFDLIDNGSLAKYGYGKYPNVVNSMEYERIMCASGPTSGDITRPSDGKHPHKMGLILCVGSRDVGEKPYCSKFCCMYATKEAIMTMEHHPETEIFVYYNDLRTIGKNHEEFIERAKRDYNVKYVRGLPSKVYEKSDTNNLVIRHTNFETGEVEFEEVDMVVLYPAVKPHKGADELNKILNVETDDYGFIKPVSDHDSTETSVPGIYVCGSAHGPEDISTSVAEASGAASKAAARTSLKHFDEEVEMVPEKDIKKEDPLKIGVFICHCGSNIAGFVDVEQVEYEIEAVDDVYYVERNLYTCSEESQNSIKAAIEKHGLNRVVIAACTPRTHLPLFQGTCQEVGINPYLVEFASIRELVSWVHMSDREKATEKARQQIMMAIAKARYIEPLHDIEVDVLPSAAVIGGGIAGMTAAMSIAKKGFTVNLIEKEAELGGFIRRLNAIDIEGTKPEHMLTPMIQAINSEPNINVHTSSIVNHVGGSIGNFKLDITSGGNYEEIQAGTIVVAVGGEEFKPNGYYKYDESENVYTNLEFEKLIQYKQIKDVKSIAFIQCVGSREEKGRTYCSLTCCGESIKNAIAVKKMNPDSQVFILYRDIRMPYREELGYTHGRNVGVKFLQYDTENPPNIEEIDGNIHLKVYDNLTRMNFELTLDKLVLATPLVARGENKILSEMLKVPIDANKFFLEAHPKLRPVDFATDGIFVAGTAQSPKNINESIAQALGASSRALIPLMNGKAVVEGAIAMIHKELCTGCETCVDICPFKAIQKDELDEIHVIGVLCKGCGTCGATCPSKAITIQHFTNEQIMAQIHAYAFDEGITEAISKEPTPVAIAPSESSYFDEISILHKIPVMEVKAFSQDVWVKLEELKLDEKLLLKLLGKLKEVPPDNRLRIIEEIFSNRDKMDDYLS
ncbi:MAG: FAD-dependent oxidoreductase [Candidatus Hodarchaeota archaeon]